MDVLGGRSRDIDTGKMGIADGSGDGRGSGP